MTTTAPRTVACHTARADTSDAPRPPVPHDMSCGHCGQGLHVHLGCGNACACGPQIMLGATAA